jgi:hypothetical protein
LGQLNLTAFVPGRIGLLQEVQWEREKPCDMDVLGRLTVIY